MEEMRALIGKRQTGELTSVARTRSSIFDTPRSLPSSGSDELSRKLEDLISDVDKSLVQALSHQEALQNELKALTAQFREVSYSLDTPLARRSIMSKIFPRKLLSWSVPNLICKTQNDSVNS